MRPGMAPGPGLEALRAAVAAAGAAGPRFARTAPFSDPHELLNCRMGAAGIGPGGLAPGARGPCLEYRLPVSLGGPGTASPLPRPQHVVKSRVFRVSAGGRGGRERALPHYFLPQVLFQSRARALTLSPKSAPIHRAQCLCCSGGSAHP